MTKPPVFPILVLGGHSRIRLDFGRKGSIAGIMETGRAGVPSLRSTASQNCGAWGGARAGLAGPMLRSTMMIRTSKPKARAKKTAATRSKTKAGQIIGLLGRPGGASIAEMMKATGWQAHLGAHRGSRQTGFRRDASRPAPHLRDMGVAEQDGRLGHRRPHRYVDEDDRGSVWASRSGFPGVGCGGVSEIRVTAQFQAQNEIISSSDTVVCIPIT